jgi:hypothetical protein
MMRLFDVFMSCSTSERLGGERLIEEALLLGLQSVIGNTDY